MPAPRVAPRASRPSHQVQGREGAPGSPVPAGSGGGPGTPERQPHRLTDPQCCRHPRFFLAHPLPLQDAARRVGPAGFRLRAAPGPHSHAAEAEVGAPRNTRAPQTCCPWPSVLTRACGPQRSRGIGGTDRRLLHTTAGTARPGRPLRFLPPRLLCGESPPAGRPSLRAPGPRFQPSLGLPAAKGGVVCSERNSAHSCGVDTNNRLCDILSKKDTLILL